MRLIIGNVQSPAHPLLRAVYLVLGAILLVVAVFFGAVVLVLAIGVILIAGSVAAVRFWWLKRKLERGAQTEQPRRASEQQRNGPTGRVIEGEFADISDNGDSPNNRNGSPDRDAW